jgi:hypothetical protein
VLATSLLDLGIPMEAGFEALFKGVDKGGGHVVLKGVGRERKLEPMN